MKESKLDAYQKLYTDYTQKLNAQKP